MKIVQIVPNFGGGGVHSVATMLHEDLKEVSERHLISLTPTSSDASRYANDRTRYVLHPQQVTRLPRHVNRVFNLGEKVILLRRLLETIQPDAVIAHSLGSINIASWAAERHKTIGVVHGAIFADQALRIAQRPLKRKFIRRALRNTRLVVGVSNGVADDVRVLAGPQARTVVIHNGIRRAATSPAKSHSEGCHRIVFLGRLEVDKNPLVLPELLDGEWAVPGVQVLVLGEGTLRASLRKGFEARGMKVEENLPDDSTPGVYMPGYVQDPLRFLNARSILLSPSLWEGLPLNLLEALAAGAKVVASDCDHGPREIAAAIERRNVQERERGSPRMTLIPLKEGRFDAESVYLTRSAIKGLLSTQPSDEDLDGDLPPEFNASTTLERWGWVLREVLEGSLHR